MEIRVPFSDEATRAQAMTDNADMRLLKEQRHIMGPDEDGNDMFEDALIFTDEPIRLTTMQEVEALKARVAALELVR